MSQHVCERSVTFNVHGAFSPGQERHQIDDIAGDPCVSAVRYTSDNPRHRKTGDDRQRAARRRGRREVAPHARSKERQAGGRTTRGERGSGVRRCWSRYAERPAEVVDMDQILRKVGARAETAGDTGGYRDTVRPEPFRRDRRPALHQLTLSVRNPSIRRLEMQQGLSGTPRAAVSNKQVIDGLAYRPARTGAGRTPLFLSQGLDEIRQRPAFGADRLMKLVACRGRRCRMHR